MSSILENTFLWAQLFGFCAMCFSICAWQLKNPRNILRCYVPSALFWSVQYFLLGSYIAVITSVFAALKDTILSFLPADKTKYLIGAFICFIWGIGLPFVNKPIDFIPLITISIFNLCLLQPDNRCLMSRINILCQLSWLVFNLHLGAWMGIACSFFVIGSALKGMIKHEEWEIGKCYRTFFPSIRRALFNFTPRTYP